LIGKVPAETHHTRVPKKKLAFAVTLFFCLAIIAVFSLGYFLKGNAVVRLSVSGSDSHRPESFLSLESGKRSFKVMTLNMGHGRKDGPFQMFQNSSSIRSHLDDIAGVLNRERPDLVALQEADGPCFWSGKFDHVEYLSKKAGYPFRLRGEHVKGLGLSYGTAFLSVFPLKNPRSITFPPSPPTFSKGYVACSMSPPWEEEGKGIDVVSLHLDFLQRQVRAEQAGILIKKLSPRTRPMIIMGDFNCEWSDKGSSAAVRLLAEKLGLKAFNPEASGLETYPLSRKRLDWILISPGLKFSGYRVLPEILSDHKAVVCSIGK